MSVCLGATTLSSRPCSQPAAGSLPKPLGHPEFEPKPTLPSPYSPAASTTV